MIDSVVFAIFLLGCAVDAASVGFFWYLNPRTRDGKSYAASEFGREAASLQCCHWKSPLPHSWRLHAEELLADMNVIGLDDVARGALLEIIGTAMLRGGAATLLEHFKLTNCDKPRNADVAIKPRQGRPFGPTGPRA